MTVPEALALVKQVGVVEIHAGDLRLKFPERERVRLQPALATLRRCKPEAMALLRATPPAPKTETEPVLGKLALTEPAAPTEPERAAANAVLGRAGVRFMELDGDTTVGIWSDLDGREVRASLAVFGSAELPIRYLDGDVPTKYKLRRVPGEPVPLAVLEAMLRAPAEPRAVRDNILEAMNWHSHGIPWAEWQAQRLNRLFKEQGVTGQRGRITAATVKHSEQKEGQQLERPEQEGSGDE